MKKAYLVDMTIRTRVIAETEEEAFEKGMSNFQEYPFEYLTADNLEDVTEDLQCPYGHYDFDINS